jgi:hypothetical protein
VPVERSHPHDGTAFTCVTGGTQFPPSAQPRVGCPICEDDRQYIHHERGQQWTTLPDLTSRHRNRFDPVEPGVTRIVTEPSFAIGQQAYVIETPEGNILWDLITCIDDPTIAA